MPNTIQQNVVTLSDQITKLEHLNKTLNSIQTSSNDELRRTITIINQLLYLLKIAQLQKIDLNALFDEGTLLDEGNLTIQKLHNLFVKIATFKAANAGVMRILEYKEKAISSAFFKICAHILAASLFLVGSVELLIILATASTISLPLAIATGLVLCLTILSLQLLYNRFVSLESELELHEKFNSELGKDSQNFTNEYFDATTGTVKETKSSSYNFFNSVCTKFNDEHREPEPSFVGGGDFSYV